MHRGIALLILGLLSGCDRPTVAPPARPKVAVLAVVYPLADIAQRVGHEHAKVDWVIESGRRLDAVALNEDLRRRLGEAQLILAASAGDEWAAANLSEDARGRRLIEPRKLPAARAAADDVYLWLDPKLILDLIEELRVRLGIIQPEQADDFRNSALTVQEQIRALDRALAEMLGRLPVKKTLVTRPVWGAFLARYGIEMIAPLNTPEEQLTDSDLKTLVSAAKQHNLSAVFVDVSTPPAVKQRIGNQTRLKVITLDAFGSSAPDGLCTYEKLLRYNAEQVISGQTVGNGGR